MPRDISTIIRVNPVQFEELVDEALRREAAHALSEQSDHENGSVEPLACPSQPPIPSHPLLEVGPSTGRPSGKQAADKLRRQRNRALRRAQCPSLPRFSNSKKHADANSITADFSAAGLPAAKGAFVSKLQRCNASQECTLMELVERGFKLVEWDGRTPTAVVDREDRIITLLAGRPTGQDWDHVHERMSTLLQEAPSQVQRVQKERRGNFTSLSIGVSHGNGRKAPANLAHQPTNKAVIDSMCQDKSFIRAAGFMSSCFAFYAPKIYKDYEDALVALFEHDPQLKKPFNNSIFPTSTLNCGARVVTLEHVDSTNVPHGLCAIFACGSYDPTLGGHLVLFNLQLVVQFPPGSTILVPSGTIRHGNTAIQPHETRQSFTQYCPGGLLRWVAYGFKLTKDAPPIPKKLLEERHSQRRAHALGLFSKVGELHSDRVSTFGLSSHI